MIFTMRLIFVWSFLILVSQSSPLQDSTLGLEEVVFSSEPSKIYVGSPSIIRVRSTQEILFATDRFGSGFTSQRNVSLHRCCPNESASAGAIWEPVGWVENQYWSNLFQLNESPGADADVYLLGTSCDGPAPIKISRSRDGGLTWLSEDAAVLFGELGGNASYETGPTPVVEHGGFVWRALERMRPPFTWGQDFEAVVLSAPADSDLIDPASWRLTPPLAFDEAWLETLVPSGDPTPASPGFLEGNVVLGPDGTTLYNLLRFSAEQTTPYLFGNTAVLLKLDQESNTLSFDSWVDLPGGHSKFVVRQDPRTGRYLTVSNPTLNESYPDQRNVLALCSSLDLRVWTAPSDCPVLLSDDTGFDQADSVRFTGFHYADWQFDGGADGAEDLILAVRTAYRGANTYHNSNRATFKRLPSFRDEFPELFF